MIQSNYKDENDIIIDLDSNRDHYEFDDYDMNIFKF